MGDSIVSLWHTDDLSRAEYARAHHRSFAFEPHAHDTTCLALIVGGALRLTLNRRTEVVGKGGFILINAGDVHAGHGATRAGWTMRTVHVSPGDFIPQVEAAGLPVAAGRAFESGVHHDPELARLFFGIHACAQINDDRLKRDENLVELVRRLHELCGSGISSPRHGDDDAGAAQRMRAYIEDHLLEPVRLSELGSPVSLPPYAAVRVFKKRFGLPPHRYHLQRRIDVARTLIRERIPLAGVSHHCGFADQAHFTRAFRRTLGFTPGAYARSQP